VRKRERDCELRQGAAEVGGERGELLDGVQLALVAGQRGVEARRVVRRAADSQVDGLPAPDAAGEKTPGKRAPSQHAHLGTLA
jgi:hypothetical protein